MNFVPILCGSAFKNKGVQTMLNSVIDYLPDPLMFQPMLAFFLEIKQKLEILKGKLVMQSLSLV